MFVQVTDVVLLVPPPLPRRDHAPVQLALSMDGKMVATASSRGTLLRVFDTDSGSLLHVRFFMSICRLDGLDSGD